MAPSAASRALLRAAGGAAALRRVTGGFYRRFAADAHLWPFLGGLQTPPDEHAARLAAYIAEMMGGEDPSGSDADAPTPAATPPSGADPAAPRFPTAVSASPPPAATALGEPPNAATPSPGRPPLTRVARERLREPWSFHMRHRHRRAVALAHGSSFAPQSRAGAHYCAWNSRERPEAAVGRRFKLDDCRVWMRLFFLSATEAGFGALATAPADAASGGSPPALPPPAGTPGPPVWLHPLFRYLVRFIGHFIAIYETTARRFTRLEARWALGGPHVTAYDASVAPQLPPPAGPGAAPPRPRRYMPDVAGVSLEAALADPATRRAAERDADGSWLRAPETVAV